MELIRFTEIILAYGANQAHWPEDERAAAESFLNSSRQAQALVSRTAEFDLKLNRYELEAVADQILKTSILEQIQPTIVESLTGWLLPDFTLLPQTLWRPTAAAIMPLLLGIAIGFLFTDDSDYELTDNEELQLLAITEESVDGWPYD